MQEDGPRSLDAHRRPRRVTVIAFVAVALVLIVALLPSPYAVEQPGPVYDTLGSSGTGKAAAPLISIPARTTYPTTGQLDLLTVSVLGDVTGGPSWLDLAQAWLDPTKAVIPLEAVFPQGETQQQADTESSDEMTESQQSAITAALTDLGYDVKGTVTIGTVQKGSAAVGLLQQGDVVTSYDGTRIQDACAFQDAVIAGGVKAATVVVTRDGTSRTVAITRRSGSRTAPEAPGPLLGVTSTSTIDPPFTVDLRIADVGRPLGRDDVRPRHHRQAHARVPDRRAPHRRHPAPSAATARWARSAASCMKMAAARAAGATLFLAPQDNCGDVVGHIPAGLDVVPVRTLSGALDVLEHVRDQGSAAGLATCAARVGSAG